RGGKYGSNVAQRGDLLHRFWPARRRKRGRRTAFDLITRLIAHLIAHLIAQRPFAGWPVGAPIEKPTEPVRKIEFLVTLVALHGAVRIAHEKASAHAAAAPRVDHHGYLPGR